jgi:protein involved in temperature-dependent protein secretion
MKDLRLLESRCREQIPAELKQEVVQKWIVALDGLDKRISVEPANSELFFKKAKLLFAAGEQQRAFQYLQTAIRFDPSNTTYHKLYNDELAKEPGK